MAIKASAEITLISIVDVGEVYRFYKLQSSTATKPPKPTNISTLPPSGWNDTEPAYTTGSTNSLYTVDLTVYSDDTFKYTNVNLSSSYEAAKQAYNKAQNADDKADSVKDYTDAVQSQFGFKYKADIVVYGDSDKYYPVIIRGGDQNVMRKILVKRGYSEQAPSDWNTASHKGGLTCLISTNFGGWGGATYRWYIDNALSEEYSTMFAGCLHLSAAFAIFLRGGGTTGAIYHLYSDQSLTSTLYSPNPTAQKPDIYYNGPNELYFKSGNYEYNAPTPRDHPRSNTVNEEIRIKQYAGLAQQNDTKIDDRILEITEKTNSRINTASNEILTQVSSLYTSKTEAESLESRLSATISHADNEINVDITALQNATSKLSGVYETIDQQNAYFNFSIDGLDIGRKNPDESIPNRVTIKPEEIAMYDKGNKAFHVANGRANGKDGFFSNSLQIATWGQFNESNGSLSIRKVDG